MTRRYDLVIIGSGTAAGVAARRAREAKWSVAVVDFRPFGGTCALRGCEPKKFLRSGTEVVDHVRRMRGKGAVGEAHIDWPELMAFKRSAIDPMSGEADRGFGEAGIVTYHARARFLGPGSLDVGGERIEAAHLLLACGAEPRSLGIRGEEHLATSEAFLSLEVLPRRIVFVGGGYIAAELAHIAARSGSKVTVLQRADRLLPRFEPELVDWLVERSRTESIDIFTRTSVTAVEAHDGVYCVHATLGGKMMTFDADLVVHAAGREPALRSLDLPLGEVAASDGHLVLNEYLQSVSNPRVYAAGDAAQVGPPLTPVASHDARVAIANMLEGNKNKPNYSGVPSVAFTIPPIAAVGLREAEAEKRGLRFRVKTAKASNWFTARRAGEPTYGYKVLIEESSDRILGAHLVGPNADDVINLFGLAIRHGVTASELRSTMFAYPTSASDIGSMV